MPPRSYGRGWSTVGAINARLSSGTFYMEIELVEMRPPCYPQFGFAGSRFAGRDAPPEQGVGDDALS